ncbi:MAG: uroporphyrinogen-III synthase [Gammaproteobacteria bacterium]|nr:uroporphyrinogen-III synthase [Gammaproteobacteria bacterium]
MTRPAHQAENFCRLIEDAGGTAIRFPVITIKAIENSPTQNQQLATIDQYDIVIFVSTNAVQYALPHWPNGLPVSLMVAAVGNKTAANLRAHGITVDVLPKQGFNTESLLESPLLHSVEGKQIAIIRGIGGRTLLADTLRQRGAKVTYIEVYQRVLPKQRLCSVNIDLNCDIITVTSQQGLRNLITLSDDKDWLFSTALASNSQRTAKLARELGFTYDIVVSPEPSDDAMVTTIASWWQNKARPQA